MEEFKECSYLPDGFTVNASGDVKSKRGKLLKKQVSNSGYIFYVLSSKNKQFSRFAHRAVAFSFLPPIKGKSIVNHKDGNKKNNSISNLEWCTYSENNIHSMKIHGHKPPVNFKGKFGSEHNRSKKIKCLENGVIYGSQREASRVLGIANNCICWAIKNKKPTFGLTFEFI